MIIIVILLKAPNSLHQEATVLGRKALSPFLNTFLHSKQERLGDPAHPHKAMSSPLPSPSLIQQCTYPPHTQTLILETRPHPTKGLSSQDSDLPKVSGTKA